jgi:hypothetical protein
MADQYATQQEYRTAQSESRASDNTNHIPEQREDDGQSEDPVRSKRAIILGEIENRLLRYDKVLIKARELAEFQRPSDRDWSDVRTWFWNNKPLSHEQEELFIQMKDDLITLKPRDDSGKLDSWIDYGVTQLPGCLGAVSILTEYERQ